MVRIVFVVVMRCAIVVHQEVFATVLLVGFSVEDTVCAMRELGDLISCLSTFGVRYLVLKRGRAKIYGVNRVAEVARLWSFDGFVKDDIPVVLVVVVCGDDTRPEEVLLDEDF
jgi:hypothetical protein